MSRARRVLVLMEDQMDDGQKTHQHGPTVLLKGCLADRLCEEKGVQFWDALYSAPLRDGLLVKACKGDTKVRSACCQGLDHHQRLGRVVAMVDRDKLHRPLNVRKSACRVELLGAFLKTCPRPDEVEVVLLENNMETVLRVVADLLRASDEERRQAIEEKELNVRDRLLQRIATKETLQPERAKLCELVPSWGRLVERVWVRLPK